MTNFSIKILGCGSATPSLRHRPSAQIVNHNERLFMVDCGEGAQLQMRKMKVKFSTLRHIFISHLHGDHMLGLPGLLSTLALHDIGGTVHVYMMEEGIKWLQDFMRISHHHTTLDLVFHPIRRDREIIYEDSQLSVQTVPLYHTLPCVGFIFREKPKLRKLRGDMVEFYQVPTYMRPAIKSGADFTTADGTVIPNHRLTLDPDPSRSYAYCSDTSFSRNLIADIKGTDTLYHESTYADDNLSKAKERGHSTARQAATVAREAGVKQLIIGHFSKSYPNEERMLAEALEEFPDVIVADEGMTIPVI